MSYTAKTFSGAYKTARNGGIKALSADEITALSTMSTAVEAFSGTLSVDDGTITDAKLATAVKVGNVASLTTTSKTNVVGAINEVDAHADTAQAAVDAVEAIVGSTTLTTTAQNVTDAINELASADTGFVTATGTATLTNKTLTLPKIATTGAICDGGGDEYLKFVEAATPVTFVQITSGNTTVAPRVQGAGETNTDLLLLGSGTGNVYVADAADTTKDLNFELNGATTAKTMTIVSSQTDDRSVTLPDATTTLVGTDTTDTLSNKTLTAPKIATTGTICDAGGDEYLKFVEATTPVTFVQITSGDTTVAPKVQGAGETNTDLHLLGSGTGNVYISDGTDPTKDVTFEVSGATTAKTTTLTFAQTDDRAVTFPDFDGTLATLAGTETFTNKTLTSPNFTLGISSHDYGAAATAWTLSASEIKTTILKTSNASGAADIVAPDTSGKMYILINDSGYAITLKVSGQTGIAVGDGKVAILVNDGSGDYVRVSADA